jgi:hypothetical protein
LVEAAALKVGPGVLLPVPAVVMAALMAVRLEVLVLAVILVGVEMQMVALDALLLLEVVLEPVEPQDVHLCTVAAAVAAVLAY